MSDAEVISSVLKGDTGRFESLVERYLPMVRAVCASHVYTEAVHDDLVQETFVEGYVRLNTLRRGDRFGPWLATIARRKCHTWLRREGSKRRAMDRLAHEPAPPADPMSEMARSELRAWVRKTVQRLPVKTREAVLLYYLEGYSITETARCLGVREGAVKKRLQYGRELLGDAVREHLGRQPEEVSTRESQKKRVLAALPLVAAPWLKTGTAAAATGVAATAVGGLSASGIALYATAALVVTALAFGGWQLWAHEAPPGRLEQSDASDLSDQSDPSDANLAVAAEPARESEPHAPEAIGESEAATGDLAVKVSYETLRREDAGNLGYRTHHEDGPPAVGAIVRVAPFRFNRAQFDKIMEVADIEGPVREALALRFTVRGEKEYRARAQALAVTQEDMATAGKKLRDAEGEIEKLGFTGDNALALFLTLELNERHEAIAGADGVAHFEGLSPGHYALRAWANAGAVDDDGSPSAWHRHDVRIQEGKGNTAAIRVPDRVSRIQGRVVDAETGEPVPEARVDVTGEVAGGVETFAQTDEKGEFRFLGDLGHGRFQLKLEPSLGNATAEGVREAGKPVWIELKAQSGMVSGIVYAYDGTPVPNVSIMRRDAGGSGGRGVAGTDEQGRFSYRHDGGVLILSASAGNVQSDSVELELEREESAEVEFTLPAAAQVNLNFHTEAGSAPEKFAYRHMWATSEKGTHSGIGSWRQQPDGSYLLSHLRPAHYEVRAFTQQGDYAVFSFDILEVPSQQCFEVPMKRATDNLEVHVLDERRVPVPSASIGIMAVTRYEYGSSASLYRDGKTDEQGICRFNAMPPGEYKVSGRLLGGSSVNATVIVPDQKRVELVWSTAEQPPSRSIGKDSVRPVDGTRGGIELSTEHSALFVVTPSGEVSDSKLEIGRNTLYFIKPGYTVGVASLDITPEQWEVSLHSATGPLHKPLEIVLGQEGTIYGIAANAQGAALNGAELRVLPLEVWKQVEAQGISWNHAVYRAYVSGLSRALAQNARTGADGAFRLRYLAPGYYVVGAPVGDGWAVSEPVEVRAGHETGPVVLQAQE